MNQNRTGKGSASERDPFDAIAAEPPALTRERAIAIMRERYGIDATVEPLTSERDQNFRVTDSGGEMFVLKIANACEEAEVTDLQIRALEHVAADSGTARIVPAIVPTLTGDSDFVVELDGARHVARVVTYLAGTPMAAATINDDLARSLGRELARLDTALADFEHEGADQDLLWDMKRALGLRELLAHLPSEALRVLVAATLDEFESRALPLFASLRSQVIHNDANPANVLVSDDGASVTGVIDFGDMLRAPLIVEVAVAASYLRQLEGNPLSLIAECLAGYHSVCELSRTETDVLHSLIKTRLATTVVILYWRASLRSADDPYLRDAAASEASAELFLARLAEIPSVNAAQIYAQVCASAKRSGQLEL